MPLCHNKHKETGFISPGRSGFNKAGEESHGAGVINGLGAGFAWAIIKKSAWTRAREAILSRQCLHVSDAVAPFGEGRGGVALRVTAFMIFNTRRFIYQ